jgi:class 3 adenylate cyclase
MGTKADLESEVSAIFAETWEIKEGQLVPDPANLKLSNDARHFERATILYADLSGSTNLVDNFPWTFAGEIYKTFLASAAKVIRAQGGAITSYDGDRIMAVFLGDTQTSNAAKCGLQVNWAVRHIVNPALKKQYPNKDYVILQIVGIDTSEVRTARIGVRGDNDLVWIGRAANYAAKLTEFSNDYPTWLTADGYKRIMDTVKFGGSEQKNMWTEFNWAAMNGIPVYGSNWEWAFE